MYLAYKEDGIVYIVAVGHPGEARCSMEDRCLFDNSLCFKIYGKNIYVVKPSLDSSFTVLKYAKGIFNGDLTFDNVSNNIVPRIQSLLDYYVCLDKEHKMPTGLLLTDGDKIFEISHDFSVVEHESHFAPNSMFSVLTFMENNKDIPVEKRLEQAFRMDADINGSYHYPLIIVNTKTGKKKALYA